MILPVDADQLATAFFTEHEKAYGYAPTDGRVEMVNIRLTAAVREVEQVDPQFDIPEQSDRKSRTVFFGSDTGLIEAPVFNRAALTTSPLKGPMIIEEDDATCVVPPGCTVTLDRHNNVVIEVS
jgi:N-methylhydantoinase A